jgi:hypothetical protein
MGEVSPPVLERSAALCRQLAVEVADERRA